MIDVVTASRSGGRQKASNAGKNYNGRLEFEKKKKVALNHSWDVYIFYSWLLNESGKWKSNTKRRKESWRRAAQWRQLTDSNERAHKNTRQLLAGCVRRNDEKGKKTATPIKKEAPFLSSCVYIGDAICRHTRIFFFSPKKKPHHRKTTTKY